MDNVKQFAAQKAKSQNKLYVGLGGLAIIPFIIMVFCIGFRLRSVCRKTNRVTRGTIDFENQQRLQYYAEQEITDTENAQPYPNNHPPSYHNHAPPPYINQFLPFNQSTAPTSNQPPPPYPDQPPPPYPDQSPPPYQA